MRKLFRLANVPVTMFDGYADLAAALASDTLTPGAKPEQLQSKIKLFSVRKNNTARLIYSIIDSGPHKGDILLCATTDTHDYDKIIRHLETQIGDVACVSYENNEACSAAAASEEDVEYKPVYFYSQHCIELNPDQEQVLRTPLPAIVHGAPGTGKTLLGTRLIEQYLENPITDENNEPLHAVFLFPTEELAKNTQQQYDQSCRLAGFEQKEIDLVLFLTYHDFFKRHTVEGQGMGENTLTNFTSFEKWYSKLTSPIIIEEKLLTAHDLWSSFRICSLYQKLEDYEALSLNQCGIPSRHRHILHNAYRNYVAFCKDTLGFSEYITPFRCQKPFGLIVADESHLLSGAMIQSLFKAANKHHLVALVGDHQMAKEKPTRYGEGFTAIDLLEPQLFTEYAQGNGGRIFFQRHVLTETKRSAAAVVSIINYFVDLKKQLGVNVLKNTGHRLDGSNGQLGMARLLILEKNKAELADLKTRFNGNADTVILTPTECLDEVRRAWPKYTVLDPLSALGLEFKCVIASGLLSHNQGDTIVGKLLNNSKDNPAATKGLSGKVPVDNELAMRDHWLTSIIAAVSRAQYELYILEKNLPSTHHAASIYDEIKRLCHEQGLPSSQTPLAISSPKDWYDRAIQILAQKTPETVAEAKRIMDSNVDQQSEIYAEFMQVYQLHLSSQSHPVTTNTPNATTVHKQPKSQKDREASILKKEVKPPPPEKKATVNVKQPPLQAPEKQKQTLPQKVRQSTALTALFENFNARSLSDQLLALADNDALLNKNYEYILTHVIEDPEKTTLFVQIIVNNVSLMEKLGGKPLANFIKKMKPSPQRKKIEELNSITNILTKSFCNDVNDPKLKEKKATPLYIAAKNNHTKLIDRLINLGADVNAQIESGETPAFIAAKMGHVNVLIQLHTLGADLDLAANKNATPAYIAAQNGHVAVLAILKKLGADLNKQNYKGKTPANVAAEVGNVDVIANLHELGANLDLAESNGETPAFIAALHGHVRVLAKLHDLEAKLNTPNKVGETPAFIAAQRGHLDVILFFIQKKADFTTRSFSSQNSLLQFAKSNQKATEGIMDRMRDKINDRISAGDKPEAITLSPLDMAEVIGHHAIISAIKTHLSQQQLGSLSFFNSASGSYSLPTSTESVDDGHDKQPKI